MTKIFFHSITSGSGVETVGYTIKSMFDKHDNFIHYKLQNPPHLILKAMVEEKPDVIILNELHQRAMLAVHSYKIAFPETKIILLNHCYPYLTDFPIPEKSKMFEWTNSDGVVSINDFLKEGIDHIITMNYRPPNEKINGVFNGRVIERYFPLPDKFKIETEWINRPKKFFFYGTIHQRKISDEFVSRSDYPVVDLYGKWMYENKVDDEYRSYKEKIINNKSLKYIGWIPDEKMVETLNKYKFFVMPHDGPEPFCLALAEAIRCGCIPLVTNSRRRASAFWIDWAKDCILEYQTTEKLIEKMNWYVKNDGNRQLNNALNERSMENSLVMTQRTNYEEFKKLLIGLIPT